MNKNIIGFRKGIVTCQNNKASNEEFVIDLQHFLMSFGYILNKEAYEKLQNANLNFLEEYKSDIAKYFEETIGNSKAKELSELTDRLGVDVYTSFLSLLDLIWEGSTNAEIEQVYERKEFKEISFVTEDKFKEIFTSLIQLNTALTPNDFKTVEWFAKEYGNNNIMPKEIPFKENLCMVAKLGIDVPVKTSTDVLRIATYMSNGTTDLILPPKKIRPNSWSHEVVDNPAREEAKFKKFKRRERRYLLSLINRVADASEMTLRKDRWLRLGEILHPSEYKSKFPKANEEFSKLRNEKVTSWYGYVDAQFKKSFVDGISALSKRPGEFARRLDSLLRNNSKKTDLILSTFEKIGKKISSKVLWELYAHFEDRVNENANRQIWIKGARKPTSLPELEPMDYKIVNKIQSVILKVFSDNFARLDKLGKVYIDEELRKIPVPTNMRTLQESTKVVIRGSRMPLVANKKVLRAYIHWTEGVDLDLSMSFVKNNSDKNDKNSNALCSYSNTHPHPTIRHSGDVIPEVKGNWAEYIDVDIKEIPYQYGLMTVRNFGGGSLEDVGAVIGFMERDNKRSSKKWVPDTVTNSFKVSSKGSNVNLIIIDFKEMEWILIDEDSDGIPVEFKNNINKYVKQLSELPKLSAYDILAMHAKARGSIIEDRKDAETVFDFKDFSTSYETLAGYML